MAVPINKYEISHLIVRLIVLVNVADLAFATLFPAYYQMERRFLSDKVIVEWYFASSLILPLYVGLEAWWMLRKTKSQVKDLVIDAVFVLGWFFTLGAAVLYSWTHYVMT